MRRIVAATAILLLTFSTLAQSQDSSPPAEPAVVIHCELAEAWTEPDGDVFRLAGAVRLVLPDGELSSDRAVVWIGRAGTAGPRRTMQVALLGNATIHQGTEQRTGERLLVTSSFEGTVRVEAVERLARSAAGSPDVIEAEALRLASGPVAIEPPDASGLTSAGPTTGPRRPRPALGASNTLNPTRFTARMDLPGLQQIRDDDGRLAVLVSPVMIVVNFVDGDHMELRADRAIVFTKLEKLADLVNQSGVIDDALQSVYLEGDVRVNFASRDPAIGEQRMRGERVFVDVPARKAILTQAVLHTTDPTMGIPLAVRARTLRQIADGEYSAEGASLTTSFFASPSHQIGASRVYVKQTSEGPTEFRADGATLRLMDVPLLYLPTASGRVGDGAMPVRNIQPGYGSRFGPFVRTEWGLLETLGVRSPPGLDSFFQVDYFDKRGLGGGIGGKYSGGTITETARQPVRFNGDVSSYIIDDHGEDDLGGSRTTIDPDNDIRGQFRWRHQHYLPDNWQVNLQLAYVSDPTYLEFWNQREFDNEIPRDNSVYVKRQEYNEAYTFLANYQTADFVTASDLQQEQFEVEHLPVIGYHRIGESLLDDRLTGDTLASAGLLQAGGNDTSLADQGFGPGVSPGLPAVGQTGVDGNTFGRGDLRQQVSWPVSASGIRMMPYAVARYTGYSNSPGGDAKSRLLGGAGVRLATSYWSTNRDLASDVLDLYQVRHVIEPEVHLFASTTTVPPSDVFLYEEPVDRIDELAVAQFLLRQRWQTKRGGPGRQRSVDVFTLDLEANLFDADQSDDDPLASPTGFRSYVFSSLPEASIPRDGLNLRANWRLTDTTIVLCDASYNLQTSDLATLAVGLAASRAPRLAYYIGNRYIAELDSNITTFTADYELTEKYRIAFSQSWDFGAGENVASNVSLTRRFDRYFLQANYSFDQTNNESSFSVNLVPEFLGVSTGQIAQVFQQR